MNHLLKNVLCLGSALMLSASLSTPSLAAPEAYDVKVNINGTALSMDPGAYLENNRTLVPLAQISQAFGAEVEWVQDHSVILLRRGGETIKLQIGYNHVATSKQSNIQYYALDSAPQIIDDRTYVPLSAITIALGAEVAWDGASQTANINLAPATGSGSFREGTVEVLDNEGNRSTQTVSYYSTTEPLLPEEAFGFIPEGSPLVRDNAMTTGNQAFDFIIDSLLGSILTPDMSAEEELKAAYAFVVANYDHNYGFYSLPLPYEYYKYSMTSAGPAYTALITGEGTCYHISSIYLAMTLRMGYPSFLMDGDYLNSNGSSTQHHWVSCIVDGSPYHFDPDIESIFRINYGLTAPAFDKFMQTPNDSRQFHIWDWDTESQWW